MQKTTRSLRYVFSIAALLAAIQLSAGCGGELSPAELQQELTLPSPNPPPASCNKRRSEVTGIQVVVRVDEYQGLIKGRNGTHEIAYGTVIGTPWVFDSSIVDTSNVQLAMNVASAKDPAGFPKEIRLSPDQHIEVEGEYIPAATADAHDKKGAAAVIHFSHAPCGYVNIDGTVYK